MIHDNQILFTQHGRKQSRNLVKDQMLHIGFTSGTTGLPKAYYRNEQSWIVSYEENEELLKHETEVFIAPGSLSHSLSLYACIYALFIGRTFIRQKVFNVNRLIDLINEIVLTTSLFVVPTMLHQFIVQKGYTHSIKSIFSSGAKLSQDQFQKVTSLYPNTDLIEFFGTSEASFISYNFNQTAPIQSVGKLFSNVDIRLLDSHPNGFGLSSVRSNMTFSGYVNSEYDTEGWIETGDYAYIQHRNLFLVGRKSDRIIVGGVNVYPSEIERLIMNIEGVKEAIVIEEPHHKFGEISVLLYTGDKESDYFMVKRYLIQHLSRYEVPSKFKK